MVTDIVSDDEGKGPKKGKKKKEDQEQVFNNIKSGIDNLLDSEDSDPPNMNDGHLIEKDLDNWF